MKNKSVKFDFGPVVQEDMSFKDISYLELWRPFVQRSRIISAILEAAIMMNNSVKLLYIWTSGSGNVV